MTQQEPFHELRHSPRTPRVLLGIGGLALTVGIFGSCSRMLDGASQPSVPIASTQQSYDINLPKNIITPKSEAVLDDAIEANVRAGELVSVELFGYKNYVIPFSVKSENGFVDLTPPLQDGIFSVTLPHKEDNPEGYEFNGSIRTNIKGEVEGSILLIGHSNSGGDWIMNNIDTLKKGETYEINLDYAIVTIRVTKVTRIKKEGDNHGWPGFEESLGQHGAIVACALNESKDAQTGYVTSVGIDIVELKQK